MPRDGRYEVLASYPRREGATPRAVYEVAHAGGNTRVEIDQRHWSGRWIKLGEFEPKGGRLTVTVSGAAPGELAPGTLSVARWP